MRLKVLQALENKLAKEQHREPVDVVVHERSDWNCLGMFTVQGGQKRLYIHENLLLNPAYRFHALETIIHEGRHATQFEEITKDKLHWWNFRAKRWKKNFSGYVSAHEDEVLYNNQAVERDAQRYTIKKLQRLAHKYRNEKDFDVTLRRNIYRYEHAESEVKNRYGTFYRHKLKKEMDNRQR